MRRRRRSRARRRAAAVGVLCAALAGLGWAGAPRALSGLSWFRLRQIELVGVKNLAPDAIITALRLPSGASVFTDTRLLADRLRGLNGVADASVTRRLPGTLAVSVTEVEPTALAPGVRGRLVAVDARGRPLPFDPDRTGLELPVVAAADSGVAAVLALVQSVEPALFQSVTRARARSGDAVELDVTGHRVLFARDAGPEEIRAVVAVTQDLAAKGRAYGTLDARFAGQVVVRGGDGGEPATAPRARHHRHRRAGGA